MSTFRIGNKTPLFGSLFILSLLSLFNNKYYHNRGKRSGEIDPVQSVHASVRVDAESLGVEKARGE